jgi:hypothetical protein
MTKRLLSLGWASVLALTALNAHAQTPVSLITSPYTQNFDGLNSSNITGSTPTVNNTKATLPGGWDFFETAVGTSAADNTYSANNGSSNSANTYSYGAASGTNMAERAFGSLRSGSLIPTIGGTFTNNTGAVLTSLTISYTGETWRVGSTGRSDKLTFQYSTNASSLTDANATWTSVTALDYANNSVTSLPTNGTAAPQQTTAVKSTILNLNIADGTTFWIRWNDFDAAGADDGTAVDDFSMAWGGPLSPSTSTLAFGSQPLGSSTIKTYQLKPNGVTDPTTVATSGPYTVSKDGTAGSFSASIAYTAAELASTVTVYVRYAPTTAGAATGNVSNTTSGTTADVALSGSAYDPTQTSFNFDYCTGTTDLSDGWQQYSVTGAQTWACTTFGHDRTSASTTANAPYGVQMNGYVNANLDNVDWLISPSLNLSAMTYPTLNFWERTSFQGPDLSVRVSTNYSGSGDPSLATWTTINAILPAVNSNVWTKVGGLDLSAFKGSKVYVAFVYTSNTSAAARVVVDDISVTDQSAAASPALAITPGVVYFGNQPVGGSGTQSFSLAVANITSNITVSSSTGFFQVAKNGGAFASSITLTPAELNGPTTLQVKFTPATVGLAYSGTVTVATAGATSATVQLNGDAYDLTTSLEVVDWNMEWFGSNIPLTGQTTPPGPSNKDLQQANATTVLKSLKADVFMLQEVVDLPRLQQVVADLSAATGINYAYQVSDFGSYADDANDPDYPGDQKLTFIYNTAVVSPIPATDKTVIDPGFLGLLRCTEAASKAGNCPAYYPWASGRFPYMMTANVTLNGVTKLVRFVSIHAKANSQATSASDYQRRKDAANLLKSYLDANYPNDNIIIAGDYNDVLNGTIATSVPAGTPANTSSYSSFLNDQANYVPITLALANSGAQSTAGFPTVIDNTITSNEMGAFYIPGSAAVRTDIASQIADYSNTTSDHYPVQTRYSFATPDLVISTPNQLVINGIYNSITVTGSGSGSVQAPVTVNSTVTVQNGGRLDTNCQPITGNGTFTVADGATLGICDANGIATTGNTGAVQVTGTRSFSNAASYVYNGTSAQVTGAGLPSQVLALSTTNASTVTLSQPLAVAQTLTLASSGNVALNGHALTLLSSASGTALVVNSGGGTVTGTATVQRYLDGSLNSGLGYRQLSAPVSNSTVADLATASFSPVVNPSYNTSATPGTTRPYPTVYGYNESRLTTTTNNLGAFDKGWFSPASLTDALTVGKGYTVNLAANQVVDFVGTLNNGDLAQSLTRQDQTNDGGWQLLGNPYPSPLDWSQVSATDRTGLDGAVYISQSTGQYAGTYRSSVNNVGGGSIIPVGQGFFARVTQGQNSASLTLRNSQRLTSYATQVSVLRTTADLRSRINLTLGTASGNLDGLYVYAEAGATAGFDAQKDAAKLPNTNGLNLAALTTDGQPLSIQGLAALSGRVALRVQAPAAGTYTLAAAELLNLPAGTTVVLEDTQTGQRTPLAAGTAYSFTLAASDKVDGRFWLNLNATAPLATLPGALQTALTLYPNPSHHGQATLLVPTSLGAGQVQVLDALGRLVRQQPLAAGGSTTLQLAGLPAGVYVVRVQTSGEQATRRLTID